MADENVGYRNQKGQAEPVARPVAQQSRPPCPVNVVHEVSVAVSLLHECPCKKAQAVPMEVDVVELLKRSCGTSAAHGRGSRRRNPLHPQGPLRCNE